MIKLMRYYNQTKIKQMAHKSLMICYSITTNLKITIQISNIINKIQIINKMLKLNQME